MFSPFELTLHAHPLRARWLARLLHDELGPSKYTPHPIPLFPFQRVLIPRIMRSLQLYSGALLADDLGLGKTYSALAVAHSFKHTLLLAPAALLPMWKETSTRHAPNLSITSQSHTLFTRSTPQPPNDPANTLILIDEAHAFANPTTQAHNALKSFLRSTQSPTLLLSATPMGLSPNHLQNLLELFLPPWFEPLVLRQPLTALLDPNHPQHNLSPLLRTVLLRRTRPCIPHRSLAPRLHFPTTEAVPILHSPTPHETALYEHIQETTQTLNLQTLDFIQPPLHILLLDRLSSSPQALAQTLLRLIAFTERLHDAATHNRTLSRSQWHELFPNDTDTTQHTQLSFAFVFPDTNTHNLDPDHIDHQRKLLQSLHSRVQASIEHPDHGLKIDQMINFMRGELQRGNSVLAFSQYTDTVDALYNALRKQLPRVPCGWITGQDAHFATPDGHTIHDRTTILQSLSQDHREPSVLCATDVLAEGFNLQSFRTVLSCDIPWNPRRLFQRFGRSDRPSPNPRHVRLAWLSVPQSSPLYRDHTRAQRALQRTTHTAQAIAPNHSIRAWLHSASDPTTARDDEIQDTLRALSLMLFDADQLRAWSSPPHDPNIPLGWITHATPTLPPGTLMVFSIGIERTLPHICFVPPQNPPQDLSFAAFYQRIRSTLRRPSTPSHTPPTRALRLGLAHALRAQDHTRLAIFTPPPHRASCKRAAEDRAHARTSPSSYTCKDTQYTHDQHSSAHRWNTSQRHPHHNLHIPPTPTISLHAFVHFAPKPSAEKKNATFSSDA